MARTIRWCGQGQDGNDSPQQPLEERYGTTAAYRRRESYADTDRMNACRLRRLESYPSSQATSSQATNSQAMASTTSADSPTSSGTSSVNSTTDQLHELHHDPSMSFPQHTGSDPLPATSRDFADLFPSSRKFAIRHDDTTLDGNMNIRVDAAVTTARGVPVNMTIFHLRMYDLRCRDFSLRRYARDSGREVCHCSRKVHKSILGARPNIHRSLGNAFAAMLPKHEQKHSQSRNLHDQHQQQHEQQQQQQQHGALKRHDSGYDTMHSDDEVERPHSSSSNKAPAKDSADSIKLEFSNYAHVDIKRRGFKADKRYDFDYWGVSYSWHRQTQKMGRSREVSYHLTQRNGGLVARIVPETLSEEEALEEREKGGWVPPCSLRVVDKKVNGERLADLGEVIVSTGLIVLVDDNIRRQFHRQEARNHFRLPTMKGGRSRSD